MSDEILKKLLPSRRAQAAAALAVLAKRTAADDAGAAVAALGPAAVEAALREGTGELPASLRPADDRGWRRLAHDLVAAATTKPVAPPAPAPRPAPRGVQSLVDQILAGTGSPAALDLGADSTLPADARTALREAGIHTLAEWAAWRSVETAAATALGKALTDQLDARARLAALGVGPDLAKLLVASGIRSALDLAMMGPAASKRFAGTHHLAAAYFGELVLRARTHVAAVGAAILDTARFHPDVLHKLGGKKETDGACACCPDSGAATSRYAYFLYLVALTGEPLTTLEAELHAQWDDLGPADDRDAMAQIDLCVEILDRAHGPLTTEQAMPFERRCVVAELPLANVDLQTIAADAHQVVPTSAVADLVARLGAALTAPILAPVPAFTEDELRALASSVRQHATEHLTAEVSVEPEFAGAPGSAIAAEVAARRAAFLAPGLSQARVAKRDALRRRAQLTDEELFLELCIETTLDPAVTTTRLGQAVRSVQAWLERERRRATDQTRRAALEYLSYEAWRALTLADLHPELRALLRDDVLTTHDESWDRGSICRNRSASWDSLRRDVADVAKEIANCRIDDTHDADHVDYDSARPFLSSELAADFQTGLGIITGILDADDQVAGALASLDEEEPGIALAKLATAGATLDAAIADVFRGGSPPNGVNPGDLTYEALGALPPAARQEALAALYDAFMTLAKPIYSLGPTLQITGIDPNSGAFTTLDGWSNEEDAWSAGGVGGPPEDAGQLLHAAAPGGSHVVTCVFHPAPAAAQLANYTLKTTVRLRGYGGNAGTEQQAFGVVARDAAGAQYRLVVADLGQAEAPAQGSDHPHTGNAVFDALGGLAVDAWNAVTTPSSTSDSNLTPNYYWVQLQKVQVGGPTVHVMAEETIDGRSLPNDSDFTFFLEVRGTHLVGVVTLPGGRVVRVEQDDDGQPFTVQGQGGFGAAASRALDVRCSPFEFTLEEGESVIRPFPALTRKGAPGGVNVLYASVIYDRHVGRGDGISRDLPSWPILVPALEKVHIQSIARTPADAGFLVFRRGQRAVLMDGLDLLLDDCLSLAFHLKYAAIPVRTAQAHLLAGNYAQAARDYALVYDDEAADELGRHIFPRLGRLASGFGPAVTADARLLRLRLGEVLLAWADWLFRQGSDEQRYRARRLCERVLALHDSPECCRCGAELGAIRAFLNDAISAVARGALTDADRRGWAIVSRAQALLAELDEMEQRCVSGDDLAAVVDWLAQQTPADARAMLEVLAQLGDELDAVAAVPLVSPPRTSRPADTWARARQLFDDAELVAQDRKLEASQLMPPPAPSDGWVLRGLVLGFCAPEDPLVTKQKRQACLLLALLNAGQNVLGFDDSQVPPLRFEALIKIARDFTDVALAAERDLLAAREQAESAFHELDTAQQSLAISAMGVDLEQRKLENAAGEVRLAAVQLDGARFVTDHYETLIANGLSFWEDIALASAWSSFGVSALSLFGSGLAPAAGAVAAIAALQPEASPLLVLATMASGGASMASAQGSAVGPALTSLGAAATMQASFERREEEWRYQLGLSRIGAEAAEQGLQNAFGRYEIAATERGIAELQLRLAADGVQFLQHKLLDGAMRLWMLRTIREQYRLRLRYAIAAAYMAERALAFEQQQPIRVIRFDYLDPTRDGLLGATQLLTDLATLEETRLATQQRSLEITKTISLAQAAPMELQIFRAGLTGPGDDPDRAGRGVLAFRTPLAWFDRDFPGHYLRLVKSVKVTILALVPPVDGIHATLSSSGVSRVVVGPPFEPADVRRFPESIALSVPFQASGVFVLDYKDDLLLPFEGSGVDTDWRLELPQAANRFDFSTILDVLFTIEYTALPSDVHAQEVKRRLGAVVTGDRVFSLRAAFADAWYDLHNAGVSATPWIVELDIDAGDFPPGVRDRKIVDVSLFAAFKDGAGGDLRVERLDLATPAGPLHGGAAQTDHGVISTRRDAGVAWRALRGADPAGAWTLEIDAASRDLFDHDLLDDVVLVVSFAATGPSWPR